MIKKVTKTKKSENKGKKINKRFSFKDDADYQIILIIFGLSVVFGYTLTFFDFTQPLFVSLLTNPLYATTLDEMIKSIVIISVFTMFLYTIFIFPGLVYSTIVGVAIGSYLPYLTIISNIWLKLLILINTYFFSKVFLRLSYTGIKLGRFIIELFKKQFNKNYEKKFIEFKDDVKKYLVGNYISLIFNFVVSLVFLILFILLRN